MSNEEILQKFKEHLILTGKSLNYYQSIKYFFNHNTEFTEESVKNFIMEMIVSKKYKNTSINHMIMAMSGFNKFIEANIKIPTSLKTDSKQPDYISLEYFEKNIMPMVEELLPKQAIKISAMLYLMFYTGLRSGEVISLKRENFNLKEKELKIYNIKSKLENTVFFTEKVRKLLENYFAIEEEEKNAFNTSREHLNYIFKKLKPYFKDIKLRPRLFRHSFATNAMCGGFSKDKNSTGIDIVALQSILGHKNIRTTLVYINRNPEIIKKMYQSHIK